MKIELYNDNFQNFKRGKTAKSPLNEESPLFVKNC